MRGPGMYLNLFKFVPVVLIYLLWAWTTDWVEHDTKELNNLKFATWNSVVFFSGVLGLILVLAIPIYPLGLGLLLLAYFIPLFTYVYVAEPDRPRRPEGADALPPRRGGQRPADQAGDEADVQQGRRARSIGPARRSSSSARARGATRKTRRGSARPRNRGRSWRPRSWSTTPCSAGRPTSTSSRPPSSSRCGTGSTASSTPPSRSTGPPATPWSTSSRSSRRWISPRSASRRTARSAPGSRAVTWISAWPPRARRPARSWSCESSTTARASPSSKTWGCGPS